jgi:hypothetical protein
MTALDARPRVRRAAPLSRTLLLRCALYLGPLSVAIAAAGFLGRLPWLVPAGTMLLGWSTMQALGGAAAGLTRRAGSGAGTRLVGLGFLAAAALWCGLVLLAPASVTGTGAARAIAVGLCGLTALATVTAARAGRTEAAVVRWGLPCWLLAAVAVAGAIGDTWAARVPVLLLLPLAVAAAAWRAFRPALRHPAGREAPLHGVDLREMAVRAVLGAGQATGAVLLWRAGPPAATSPVVLPLLAAVPLLEALTGWHRRQVESSLDRAESTAEHRRHVSGVTLVTVAALAPAFAVGVALMLAAYRMPVGAAKAHETVLAVAGGVLLSGVVAGTLLLAAHGRTTVAALLAAGPPLAALASPLIPALPPDPLHTVVAILAAAHLIGLLTVAHTAADPRRTS